MKKIEAIKLLVDSCLNELEEVRGIEEYSALRMSMLLAQKNIQGAMREVKKLHEEGRLFQ
ncbi:hypothetical protein [Veillonella magna]|uniref:hypothetical protein n=1 Tax=Veillonella magna TaxID=464322 RepID=UPI002665656E|nr:hypothetical protein [Veillonella magna]